jgi:dTDP-4-amino-4,6-dideoxygalactose transaminase
VHSSALLSAPVPQPSASPVPVARPFMPTADTILPYLERIDAKRWYSNFGPLLIELEARLAARFAKPTLACTAANGTQTLTLALMALGAKPGGLCVIPSWTFVATAHAAIQAGLVPWFVDVDPVTGVLDADHVRERLTHAPGPVSAIVPVAAFGQPLDPAPWAKLAEDTGLPVVIDAAASFDSVSAAPIPTMVSLHATKSLGIGEGGFIASEDAGFIDRFRALTSFGFMGDREARFAANNAKLSEYTCAVGMAALDQWPSTRTAYATTAQRLRMALLHTPSVVFQPGWGLDWVSSTCVVELPEGATSAVEVALKAQGVDSRRWWGNGCHRAPAFAHYPADALPASERFAASTLGLPYFADMDIDQVNRVALALAEALA